MVAPSIILQIGIAIFIVSGLVIINTYAVVTYIRDHHRSKNIRTIHNTSRQLHQKQETHQKEEKHKEKDTDKNRSQKKVTKSRTDQDSSAQKETPKSIPLINRPPHDPVVSTFKNI
ncbi:hypothetical protein NEOKW01_0029 [Nematocida sp. AWRm80]|nr:hypothetical protein NEOKW01_0029 [Nematocida sp. AWRm80]